MLHAGGNAIPRENNSCSSVTPEYRLGFEVGVGVGAAVGVGEGASVVRKVDGFDNEYWAENTSSIVTPEYIVGSRIGGAWVRDGFCSELGAGRSLSLRRSLGEGLGTGDTVVDSALGLDVGNGVGNTLLGIGRRDGEAEADDVDAALGLAEGDRVEGT